MSEATSEAAALAEGLAALAPALAPGAAGIEGLRRLSGGASQETWAFRIEGGGRALILRRAPAAKRLGKFGCGLAVEAALIARARAAGAPAPEVAYELRPEDGIGEGYIMERVEGETLPARIFRDPDFAPAREGFARQAGEILAALHRVSPEGLDLEVMTPAGAVADLAERHAKFGTPRPVFSLALKRLEKSAPKGPARAKLAHGDFRMGNLMLGPEGVRAVLDWELAHAGDPMADLGWLCMPSWRFGGAGPVGGLGPREALYDAYEAAGGELDREAARWWELHSALRWGVICEEMGAWVREGLDRSIERQMIARRASETELILMTEMFGEVA